MNIIILAGGLGTRITEQSQYKPKPMIEIGSKPILWHIMKMYSYYGYNDFIICAGYKQYVIKEWFNNYFLHNSDVTFDYTNNNKKTIVHNSNLEKWKVTIVDTGESTMTGGRIKRIKNYIGNEPFMLTYGDAVCDVDISKLVDFHKNHGRLATLTSVVRDEEKGVLEISSDNAVKSFREKNKIDSTPINAGFMVLEPQVFDYIEGDETIFERDPLEKLAEQNQLMSYSHKGFWQCMDTIREHDYLEQLIDNNNAPWIKWEE